MLFQIVNSMGNAVEVLWVFQNNQAPVFRSVCRNGNGILGIPDRNNQQALSLGVLAYPIVDFLVRVVGTLANKAGNLPSALRD